MADVSTDERRRPAVVAHAMRRRWRTVVGAALIFIMLAAAFAFTRSHRYTATTTVFVRPLVGNAFTSDAQSNSQVTTIALNTEASLVDSADVTDRVNAQLGTHLTAGSAVVSASVPVETQLVLIQAGAGSQALARRYASAYASAFLDYRAALARTYQRTQITRLNAQAGDARTRLEAASKAANVKNPTPDAASELQLASAQLAAIQSAIGQAQSIDTDAGSVVKPAHVASARLLDSPWVIISAGLILGLALGCLLAIWREFRDTRVRAGEDGEVEGVPVLAVLPPSPTEHAVRDARTGIIAAVPGTTVLALTPVDRSQDGSAAEVAVALAGSLDAAGYRVVLVDAAVATPRVARLLNLEVETGLSEALIGEHATAAPVRAGRLCVLPAGSRTEDARERYGGAAFATLLAGLRADVDYVLVVTSALDSSDGVAALHAVEQVVLVASDGSTRRQAIRNAADTVARLSRPVVGMVAVAAPARKDTTPPTDEHRPAVPEDQPGTVTAEAPPEAAAETAGGPGSVADEGPAVPEDQPGTATAEAPPEAAAETAGGPGSVADEGPAAPRPPTSETRTDSEVAADEDRDERSDDDRESVGVASSTRRPGTPADRPAEQERPTRVRARRRLHGGNR